jgi:hypothetical protein
MNFGKLFGLAVMALGCAAAHAQLGVYGMYQGNTLSGIQCFAPATVACSNGTTAGNTGTVKPSGIQGGIYYDFKTIGPLRFGGDIRGGTFHSNKSAVNSSGGDNATHMDNLLFGLRAEVKVPYVFLKPYAQVSAGYARTDATEPYSIVEYEGLVGADIKVFPIVDLRAIELGIGNMNRIGSGNGTGSVGVKSIGIGVVFHLP